MVYEVFSLSLLYLVKPYDNTVFALDVNREKCLKG